MTSKRTLAGISAFSLLIVTAACGGSHEKAAGPSAPLPAVKANLVKAETRDVPRTTELYGTVAAGKTVAVSSRVMALVSAVHVKAGDSVAEGQVLLDIDPQTAQGQEAQAKGALAQAKAALALAERNHQRFQNLYKTGAASELELDMARMQFEQAKGAVQQGEGAVAAASSVAKESKVVAPFAGRVASRMVEPGDLAAPGRPLVMIESTAGRRLVLSVPESAVVASGLSVGKTLPVRIDSRPDMKEIAGKVAEMSPGADPASHTFMAKVDLPIGDLPTGITGRAFLATGSKKAILVPAAAVLTQGGMQLVAVRDDAGKLRTRAITTGQTEASGLVEVLSGLTGGETLLTGLSALPRDGSPVESTGEVTK
ncbi:MAG: Multidrug resistance protein MdtA [Thermoanaerobaculia bacterium]|nr:Multidrug resistance protein MdtA [Thermoanaerobaculia bacterium]